MLNPPLPDEEPVMLGEPDWEAARRAIARNWPALEADPRHAALVAALAKFHRLFGVDNFELRYNLRPPKDRTEEWERQFMHGQINEAELRARLKADAERPIDLEMLTAFHNAYHDSLSHYSGVLQKAARVRHEASASAWQASEQAIDNHVAVLRGKLPLWRENLEIVFEFLEERRITSGAGLVKLGGFEGTSAHWLAQLVFERMAEGWRSCMEVSQRSREDPRYLYSANAIDLFHEVWLPRFPTPQSISERLREEFISARAALNRTAGAVAADLATASDLSAKPGVERLIDNESRELKLIGEMFSLVADAGHIFRPTPNSDWGIDGEIEFKNGTGQASGRRVYVQLKSGDSYLVRRAGDGEDIFTVKKERHLEYWVQQAYPVMLVIRQSSGLIRWMDVSTYLRRNGRSNRQIIFRGEPLTADTVQQLAVKSMSPNGIGG